MQRDDIHELAAGYALDALDARDRATFEGHLDECEQCRRAVRDFGGTATALALATEGPVPPPALRDRILVSARAERPNVVPLRPRSWLLPATATVAAAAACVAVALGLWAASLSRELDEQRTANDVVELFADPSATRAPLQGARGTLVVARDGRAAIAVDGLRRAPNGKAYEIWVFEGKTPRRAGLFDADTRTVVVGVERRVARGGIVAVTLEDAKGVDSPTGEPLFTAQA